MSELNVGQRVKVVKIGSHFASEEEGVFLLDVLGEEEMRDAQINFERSLQDAGIVVGSEGVVTKDYSDGYFEVVFDNGHTFDLPHNMLEAL